MDKNEMLINNGLSAYKCADEETKMDNGVIFSVENGLFINRSYAEERGGNSVTIYGAEKSRFSYIFDKNIERMIENYKIDSVVKCSIIYASKDIDAMQDVKSVMKNDLGTVFVVNERYFATEGVYLFTIDSKGEKKKIYDVTDNISLYDYLMMIASEDERKHLIFLDRYRDYAFSQDKLDSLLFMSNILLMVMTINVKHGEKIEDIEAGRSSSIKLRKPFNAFFDYGLIDGFYKIGEKNNG